MLTKRQREILDFIEDYIKRRGYRPSYQQIARYFGISSKSTIAKHITLLEKMGFLQRHRREGSFFIEILSSPDTPRDSFQKIEWLSEEKQPFFVSESIFQTCVENLCAYRMPDNSMIDEHILEGDLVLIEKKFSIPKNGEIALVSVGDSLMLRKIFVSDGYFHLMPANKDFEKITVTADEFNIEGIMYALFRPQTRR